MDREKLLAELRRDEGYRRFPYKDSKGILTVAIGRNLEKVGIREDEALFLLEHDVERKLEELDVHLPWWRKLDLVRQRVLVNMAFNMGVVEDEGKLLTFKNTLAAIEAGNWAAAHAGMLASKWHRDVGKRAERLATMMLTGEEPTGS